MAVGLLDEARKITEAFRNDGFYHPIKFSCPLMPHMPQSEMA